MQVRMRMDVHVRMCMHTFMRMCMRMCMCMCMCIQMHTAAELGGREVGRQPEGGERHLRGG